MPSRRHLFAAAAPALALIALAGCSTGPADSAGSATSSQAAAAAAAAYPVTVAHAHGETTIEKAPTRIATIGWADADVVAALGVVPVGAPKITWGGNAKGSTDWFDAQAAKLGVKDGDIARYDDSAGIPFDAIAATSPDLILGLSSGVSKEEYDKLTQDRAGRRLHRQAVGHPVGGPARRDRQGPRQGHRGGRAQGPDGQGHRRRGRRQPAAQGQERRVGLVQPHRPVDDRALHHGRHAPADAARVRPRRLADRRRDEPGHERVLGEPLGREGVDPRRGPRGLLRRGGRRRRADHRQRAPRPDPRAEEEAVRASADNAVALSMSLPSPLSVQTAVDEFLPKIVSALNGTPAQ